MKIVETKITVRDLTVGYKDSNEKGVVGYNSNLNIRPEYQREFIYKENQRNLVIDTVFKGFPLGLIYWADLGNGKFELFDGQQRTISICQFVNGDFLFNGRGFVNLEDDEQNQILDYKLTVCLCSGTESEKLEWFKTINIAGERLTDQELLNAVYHGTWLTNAKTYFSKTGCAAYGLGKDYINGSPIRQEFLETALDWISDGDIVEYMAKHQKDGNASVLWDHFQTVIKWINGTFPTYRKEMKGINWGKLYNTYKKTKLDSVKLETEIIALMEDEDVTDKKGIYTYVLSHNERKLSIRMFTDKQKREAFTRQNGVCPKCSKSFKLDEMEADHIKPWSKGGHTISSNLQMLCQEDNRTKSAV